MMRYKLVTALEGIIESEPLHQEHWAEAGNPGEVLDVDLDTYKALNDSESFGILVYDQDELIGYAVIFIAYATHTKQPVAYNDAIYVKPEYRPRGIGGRLLLLCEAIAKERGAKTFQWSCRDGLELAHIFEKRQCNKHVIYERTL